MKLKRSPCYNTKERKEIYNEEGNIRIEDGEEEAASSEVEDDEEESDNDPNDKKYEIAGSKKSKKKSVDMRKDKM